MDVATFERDLDGDDALRAFRADLHAARDHGIGRFPTLVVQGESFSDEATGGLMLVGYRPYPLLCAALSHVAPGIEPVRTRVDRDAYAAFWGRLTVRELAEACDTDEAE